MRTLVGLMSILSGLIASSVVSADDKPPFARPNILWISVEDISPDLGCYGDRNAVTPTIDRLAAEGVRFTRCFTHAGVCAPSRSGLITGCYPPSIGTHHMRCQGVPPDDVRCFPEYLRQAGYYCTNNVKTDYQFDVPATAWDENSNKADWRGRDPGQPFFSVINFITTHESQIRDPSKQTQNLVAALKPEQRHDPAKMIVPPFYPDTPVVRRDIANYYDNITAVDGQVAAVLQRLEEDGLAEDTIVWFWGDHGRGMPRYKRWLYDTGLHVPLIVRVPEKWRNYVRPDNADTLKPGSTIDHLTAFVDFAPTVLSLAGVDLPKHFQGQAFFGPHRAEKPREHVYGHRDRMDETYDLIRTVRDKRFRYVRNFMPWQPYSQDIAYMNEMPTMQEWRRLHAEGKLTGPAADWFRKAKPVEELYDTETDPFEINNLAADPRYVITLERLRVRLEGWMREIGDVGLIPEPLFDELQRPDAKYDRAAAPGIAPASAEIEPGLTSCRLNCLTTGASIAYRIRPATAKSEEGASRWKVAPPNGVVPLQDGDELEAKACRIGFHDSEVIKFKHGQPAIVPAKDESRPHWRTRAVGSLGFAPQNSVLIPAPGDVSPVGKNPLSEPKRRVKFQHPAHAFWLMGEWGRELKTNNSRNASVLRDVIYRESPVPLKLVAARWLSEVEDSAPHLKLLVEALAHPQSTVQLQAITALADLGEKARPVIEDIRKATKNGEYVGRVSQRALRNLDAK